MLSAEGCFALPAVQDVLVLLFLDAPECCVTRFPN